MERKKLFVVTDVHGHCDILLKSLEEAGYNKEEPSHLLVSCGDNFDRGSENAEVLSFFDRIENKVIIRGNHESMLIEILEREMLEAHNFMNGTLQTIISIFGKRSVDYLTGKLDFSGQNRKWMRLYDFLVSTVNYFETENYVFVHGWFPEGCLTAEQRKNASFGVWDSARWIRWTDKYTGEAPIPGKTLVCGHVPTCYGNRFDSRRYEFDFSPFNGKGLIALDAATFDTGRINVLVLEDNLL